MTALLRSSPQMFASSTAGKKSTDEMKITLRRFRRSDVDDYLAMVSDQRFHPFSDEGKALKYLKEMLLPPRWCRAVCLDDRVVGWITLAEDPNPEKQWEGEIEYSISPAYWGRAIAIRAVKMAVQELFARFEKLTIINALILPENLGSRKVAGFKKSVGYLNEDVFLSDRLMVKGKPTDCLAYCCAR